MPRVRARGTREKQIEEISADDPAFDQAAAMERMQRVIEGEPQTFDWLVRAPRRHHRLGRGEPGSARPSVGSHGRSRLVSDITERKERKRTWSSSRRWSIPSAYGVAAYRESGRFEYVNQRFADILDTNSERLLELSICDVNSNWSPNDSRSNWASFEEGETRTAETTFTLDDREATVETVTTCMVVDGVRYHFGTVQDILERKRQKERFQAFVEQSNDIISVPRRRGNYKYQSPSAERIRLRARSADRRERLRVHPPGRSGGR